MQKIETLQKWEQLDEGLPILPHMRAIPYKAKGSTYGACGIRIDGTPEFIDAVLSRIKDVIDGENAITRLNLARNKVKPTKINGQHKGFENSEIDAEVCYIRLHKRGNQSGAGYDKKLRDATERYAESIGA